MSTDTLTVLRHRTSWWRAATVGLLGLWLAWPAFGWWTAPRQSTVEQALADVSAGRVTGYHWAPAGSHPSRGLWSWAVGAPRNTVVYASPEHAPVLVWRTPDRRVHFVTAYVPEAEGVPEESPDTPEETPGGGLPEEGTPTPPALSPEARALHDGLQALHRDSERRGEAGPQITTLDDTHRGVGVAFTLLALAVLVVGPAPLTGTRWYWFWFGALPLGLGIVAWLLVERPGFRATSPPPVSPPASPPASPAAPVEPSTDVSMEPPAAPGGRPRRRSRGLTGFLHALVLSWLLTAVVAAISSALDLAWL